MIIFDEKTGISMAEAVVPEGWTPAGTLDTDSDYYNGYRAAANFWINLRHDPDGMISLFAPKSYLDDGTGGDRSLRDETDRYIIWNIMSIDNILDCYAREGLTYETIEPLEMKTYVTMDREEAKRNADEYYTYAKKLCSVMGGEGTSFILNKTNVINGMNTYRLKTAQGLEYVCAVAGTRKAASVTKKDSSGEKELIYWSLEDFTMLTCSEENYERYIDDFITFSSSASLTDEFTEYQQKAFIKRFPVKAKAKGAYTTVTVSDENGSPAVSAAVREGWKGSYRHLAENHGYGLPFGFRIYLDSPDGSSRLCYRSPLNAVDESREKRKPYDTKELDLYGNLRREYMPPPEFMERQVTEDIGSLKPVLTERRDSPLYPGISTAERSKKLREDEESGQSTYTVKNIDFCLRDSGVWIYSYRNGNTDRVRAYHASFRVVQYKSYVKIPQDPFYTMAGSMIGGLLGGLVGGLAVPPGMSRGADGSMLSLSQDRTTWYVYDRFYIDAMKEDFEALYSDEFVSFMKSIRWKDELNERLAEKQSVIDSDLAGARKIFSEMEEQSREASRETYEYVRKTQQEIADMQRDSWKKASDTRHRTSMLFSETMSGRYTYTDSMGREHKVDGYGKHTYMHGDTIVNTDSPYPPGPGWEELKKKYEK